MSLLNYTTKVPVQRTVGQVQELLVRAGATSITARYEAADTVGLTFVVDTEYGRRAFSLPVDGRAVYDVMRADTKVPRSLKTIEQAQRVAWRITKDWVEAQLAIIATRMVTLDQVMFPYMEDVDGRTVFDLYVKQQLVLESGDT